MVYCVATCLYNSCLICGLVLYWEIDDGNLLWDWGRVEVIMVVGLEIVGVIRRTWKTYKVIGK